jgi:hypothetical protein
LAPLGWKKLSSWCGDVVVPISPEVGPAMTDVWCLMSCVVARQVTCQGSRAPGEVLSNILIVAIVFLLFEVRALPMFIRIQNPVIV